MSAKGNISVSISYIKSINLTLTEEWQCDTLRGIYINHITYLWQQYNKDKIIITHTPPSAIGMNINLSFIDCSREMNRTTQVLTVYPEPFIKVVSVGSNTCKGPNNDFYLPFTVYNSCYLNI